MKKLVVILLFITTSLLAEESHVFRIAGKYYGFQFSKKLLVEKSCKNNCIALKKANDIKPFKLATERGPAMSLGSYVCDKVLNGKSLLGIDTHKDMKAFCYFPEDESMVEINSLEEHAKTFLQK